MIAPHVAHFLDPDSHGLIIASLNNSKLVFHFEDFDLNASGYLYVKKWLEHIRDIYVDNS